MSDSVSTRLGIHKAGYSVENGALTVWVNGHRIMCRGGNWGMPEAMMRYDPARLRAQMRLQKQANFTMLRNWVALARNVYPRITAFRAKKSVELLLSLGMVVKNEDGTYSQVSKHVTAGKNPVAVMLIRQHHRESLENAAAAIDAIPPHRRSCTSQVMSITEETYRDGGARHTVSRSC